MSALRFAELRAIIGGERDPMRAVWDERATLKDRRLLLAMAGRSAAQMAWVVTAKWVEVPAETRTAIAGGLRRWRSWADAIA